VVCEEDGEAEELLASSICRDKLFSTIDYPVESIKVAKRTGSGRLPHRLEHSMREPNRLLQAAIELSAEDEAALHSRARVVYWRTRLVRELGQDSPSVRGIRAGVMIAGRLGKPTAEEYEPGDLVRLREDVVRVLRPVSTQARTRSLMRTSIDSLSFVALPYRDRSVLVVSGTVRDVFMYVLLLTLAQEPNASVRRCQTCGEMFMRAGKRLFCSRRCTNKASMTRWHARHGVDAARRAKRRLYEKKVAPARPRPYQPRRA
jgi:hypothetical protein